jgi:hypothetical protein
MTTPISNIQYIRPDAPTPPESRLRGASYESWIPATLDLAERARLAINGMTEPTDPEADYRVYWKAQFRGSPPFMYHDVSDTGITIKFLESAPRMRLMSGSTQNLHVEARWKEALLRMIGPDGLVWTPLVGRGIVRPGKGGAFAGDHVIDQQVNGLALGAITTCALLDGGDFWQPFGRGIVEGLAGLAVPRGDMAYLPEWWYAPGRHGSPTAPRPPGAFAAPAGQPDEDVTDDPAAPRPLGTFAAYQIWPARRLVDFYRASGYKPALRLAGQFCRYVVREGQYFGPHYEFLRDNPDPNGPRHGVVHFHHHAMTILTCLEYGLAAGDQELLDFATRAFPVARTYGEVLTGFFPESALPEHQTCEICEVGDMVRIAVRLAEAGLGDAYWDDADRWMRNQLAEGQLLRHDWIHRLHVGDPPSWIEPEGQWPMTTERVGERNIGAFAGWQSPNDWIEFALTRWEPASPKLQRLGHIQGIMHCCTANGTRGLYDVWRNIVHATGDQVKVNLLLNRSHEAVDVDSHVPYAGQVDLHVKRACTLSVRMPGWVELGQVACSVGEAARPLAFDGRYAQIGAAHPGETVRLRFPIGETTERVSINNRWYHLVRKGHDIVFIDPPGKLCPLYQRDHYRDGVTLWKQAGRYVAEQTLPW